MKPIRCPECHTSSEASSTACPSCGLLFLHKELPLRRQEDYVRRGRRASDLEMADCPFCLGKIEGKAVRCRHCGQIVDDEFHRQQLRKRRARVNYASWVAYVFGLVTLVLFKPVGLLAIGAGLLLSIAYYAMPVEELRRRDGESRLRRWGRHLREQFRFERVSMPMPAFRKARLIFVGTPVLATVIGYLANFVILQQPMNEILQGHPAFQGMSVSAHYDYWLVPGVVVYDLRRVGPDSTPLQVHTAFLEYAKSMRNREFERVVLRWRGQERFVLDGDAFRRAGEEYEKRNFAWVLFDLPRLFRATGATGGDTTNADALMEFHRRWYGDGV
ncbi:MAG TPA: zinc ribbon domain-containing protein [Thermoanaerobaculia bacterium]|nr:zinc ribbon domain-containing protein [Thermoanaerobaculia bacterium]